MKMLTDGNRTSHTYNEQTAKEILQNIDQLYIEHLVALKDTLQQLAQREE